MKNLVALIQTNLFSKNLARLPGACREKNHPLPSRRDKIKWGGYSYRHLVHRYGSLASGANRA